MKSRKIPVPLQRRIGEYFAYYWERQLGYDESVILSDLPQSLRAEVSIFLRRDIIQKAPIFCKTDTEFIQDLAQQLRSELFTPGDEVFRIGEEADKMYFVSHGRLEVINAEGRTVAILEEGDLFGEIALLLQKPRSATVRAIDYCDVYVLEKTAFNAALTRHPRFGQTLRVLALERRQIDEGE
jgi:voltage-gated potassium channel